jgi:hypothetical protein
MDVARPNRARLSSPTIEELARRRSRASLGASFAVRAALIWPEVIAFLFVSI